LWGGKETFDGPYAIFTGNKKEVAPKIIDMAAKFNAPYVSFQSV
jgi:hypothetical protein